MYLAWIVSVMIYILGKGKDAEESKFLSSNHIIKKQLTQLGIFSNSFKF